MSCTYPSAWWWALLILPLLLLSLGRFAARRREVAPYGLWLRALARRPAWFQLRFWGSLAAQVAILLLLVAAMAEPYWRNAVAARRNIVLVFDVSASMAATDLEPSRFAQALAAAEEAIGSLQLGERMAIVTAGSAVRTACQLTEDAELLERTVLALRPTGGASRIPDAVALARRMLEGRANPRIMIVSDGAFPGAVELTSGEEVALRRISGAAGNVAITRFEACPSPGAVADYDVLAEINNLSAEPREVTLQIGLGSEVLFEERRALTAEETWQLVPTLPVRRGGILWARVDGDDDLALDNEAGVIVEVRQPPRVLLVEGGDSPIDGAIRAAIAADPRIAWRDDADPAAAGNPLGSVTVIHRQLPEQLPPGAVLVIDPRGSCDLWTLRDVQEGEDCRAAAYRADSPLLQGVRLDEVVIEQLVRLDFRAPAEPIVASAGGDPLLSRIERPEGPVLVLHASLARDRSDLIVRADFPRLVLNSVWWLSRTQVPYRPAMATGDVIRVQPWPRDRVLQVPGGGEQTLAAGRSFLLPDRPGLWSLIDGSSSGSAATSPGLVSSLINREESELRPPEGLPDGSLDEPRVREQHPLWTQIAALALALLVVEWILYHRRVIV